MGYDGVDDWSTYTPGPDSAVVTPTTLALLDAAVPADVVERVWDAARRGGGLAAVVAPLVGSLADLPTFAVVVIDGGRPRALVRGALEVVVGETVVSGEGVATWREETLTTADGDDRVEVTVRRADHTEGDAAGLPLLAGVVRAARSTGTLELRPAGSADGPTTADGATDAAEVESESADPDPVVPIPLPVPDAVAPDGVAGEDEPFVASGESDDEGLSAESAVGLENDGTPHTDDGVPLESDDPVVEELAEHDLEDPTVAPALDGLELPGDGSAESESDAEAGAERSPEPEPKQPIDVDPDTEPLLDRSAPEDAPLDLTLQPGGEDSGYGFVSGTGSSVVPARPEAAPQPDGGPEDRAEHRGSASEPQPAPLPPLAPSPAVEPVAPVAPPAPLEPAGLEAAPAESAPAPSAPAPPAPVEPAPAFDGDDLDGDHDGGTILDHQVAGLRDAGLVTVSPWSRPAPEPEKPRLHLSFSHGVEVQLDRPVLVGRAPEARPGVDAQLVAVPSPQQDISRTHCEIRLDGEDVLVTDLRSTNGTIVSRPGQVPHRLHPGEGTSASAGSRIDLGDGVVIVVEL